jgi:hypothetical protein
MVFNAAKDLVYTINGGNISSGGYRINKILNGKSKKKGKQTKKKKNRQDKNCQKNKKPNLPRSD